jgi:hypothetical protein
MLGFRAEHLRLVLRRDALIGGHAELTKALARFGEAGRAPQQQRLD